MGCAVEKTDTGVEIEVHKFDTRVDAHRYLTIARGYKYERHETWGFTTGIDFYQGPNVNQRASLREKGFLWSVAFWSQK